MKLYPCGTEVEIIVSNMRGMVTCAAIRFDRVIYEVAVFCDGKHETIWMNEGEFKTKAKKITIGFK
jgi:hypothetical protein